MVIQPFNLNERRVRSKTKHRPVIKCLALTLHRIDWKIIKDVLSVSAGVDVTQTWSHSGQGKHPLIPHILYSRTTFIDTEIDMLPSQLQCAR